MEAAITKAIEGGYIDQTANRKQMLMEPNFWQALGKGFGWENMEAKRKFGKNVKGDKISVQTDWRKLEYWQFQALRFHEINLTEGMDKAVEYLTTLLNESK